MNDGLPDHHHQPEPAVGDIVTADGQVVREGDRVFNYYDLKWGTIEQTSLGSDGWFGVRHEDGTYATLNGERISTEEPAWFKNRSGS